MIQSIALLISVLLGVGVIMVVAAACVMAEGILRPPRMSDGKAVYVLKRLSPGDLGLRFTDERILVRDSAHPTGPRIDLAAWWIPAETSSGKCVVLLHGYADAKVGSIAWAPVWHSLGFHILAVDLRAHGESGGSESTAGFFERHDLNELLDQLRSSRPEETRELVLFGVSMGAAVALATAVMRDDLTAVVMDSPFADYRSAVEHNLDRLGLPTGVVARLAIWLAQQNSGANFAAVRPVKLIPDVPCPLMVIRGETDDFLDETESKAIEQTMSEHGKRYADAVWIVAAAGHLGALAADPDAYVRKLEEFLEDAKTATSRG
jgi:hypothetical protein